VEDVISAAKREASFEALYKEYAPRLYRFCLIQMRNSADAEDVLQEVFLKRIDQAPVFRSAEHERRWLYQVALNQCRNEQKRKHRTEVPLEIADRVALAAEEQALLEEVAALPEKLRTVIHLHYYEGYSVQEIARIVGITVSGVKMRLKRGREALKIRLEETV